MKEYAEKNFTRGYLYVKVSNINYPKIYEILKDEETGKDVYPDVKIFGFESFEESMMDVENPFVTDETETEETEFESQE